MITPRRTRLVRVPDLHAFRSAIVGLAITSDLDLARATAVVVPTRGAARQLRRTGENGPRAAFVLPDLVTRDELYARLHARLEEPPRRLNACERDVILDAAARSVSAPAPAFRLRPGLTAEMLRFYDQLRRQARGVARFEELMVLAVEPDAETDRGAARTLRQTRFLAAAFAEYERRVRESSACDEHLLRERLIAEPAAEPYRHLVVTVGDWIADPSGLYLADFDLLTRLPGLEAIDVIVTAGVLASGMHQRIHDWLPDIEEVDAEALGIRGAPSRPRLMVPSGDRLAFEERDREEELVAVARRLKALRREGIDAPLDRTAVVFRRPLPYLYLAQPVLGGAGIPYHASDALPLAAEPAAAALDELFDFVSSSFTRAATVALLRSPHFRFAGRDGDEIGRSDAAAVDRLMSESRHLGGLDALERLATGADDAAAGRTLEAVLDAARALAPLADAAPASAQIARVLAFLDAHLRPVAGEPAERQRRGWAAILSTLRELAAAHAAHGDRPVAIDELAVLVRRWIEEQTFVAAGDEGGVQLVDDQAARYGEFDDLTLVGLVEGEWPERPRRNIFYSSSLLSALGWPSEKDRRGAAEARFLDLLASAAARVVVSRFTLEDEALVEPSVLVDEIPRAKLSSIVAPVDASVRIFAEEALSREPIAFAALAPGPREAAELRAGRSPSSDPRFHGTVGSGPSRPWAVSALETYVSCPFKFFAERVLKLQEEPDDEETMDPRTEGQFVHDVFEAFFSAWQAAGRGAITPELVDEARGLFVDTVDRLLDRLPGAEAGLARTRLLGSPAVAGLGEAVIRMEAERPIPVVERLLEHKLEGEFTFATDDGPRTVALRGKADRVDLLADGTFRLIDYKLGWPPNKARALQLPIYSVCAEQRLDGYRGRRWRVGEAAYLAFKGPKRVVPLFPSPDDRDETLADASRRLIDTIDAIARGEFPPTPDDVFRCETCSFTAVCRKDYVGDV